MRTGFVAAIAFFCGYMASSVVGYRSDNEPAVPSQFTTVDNQIVDTYIEMLRNEEAPVDRELYNAYSTLMSTCEVVFLDFAGEADKNWCRNAIAKVSDVRKQNQQAHYKKVVDRMSNPL